MVSRGGKRENAGRPKKRIATKTLSVRLPITTIDIMRKHAEFCGISTNKLIKESIVMGEYLAYNNFLKINNTKKQKDRGY